MECIICYQESERGTVCPHCNSFYCDECWSYYNNGEKTKCCYCTRMMDALAEIEARFKYIRHPLMKTLRDNYNAITNYAGTLSASRCMYNGAQTSSILLYLFEYMRYKFQAVYPLQLYREEEREYTRFEKNVMDNIDYAHDGGFLMQTLIPANNEFKSRFIRSSEQAFYPFKQMSVMRFNQLLDELKLDIKTTAPAIEPEALWDSRLLHNLIINRINEEFKQKPFRRSWGIYPNERSFNCVSCYTELKRDEVYVADNKSYCQVCAAKYSRKMKADEDYCWLCNRITKLDRFFYIKPKLDYEVSEHAYFCNNCHRCYYTTIKKLDRVDGEEEYKLRAYYAEPDDKHLKLIPYEQLVNLSYRTIYERLYADAEVADGARKEALNTIAQLYEETFSVEDAFAMPLMELLEKSLNDVVRNSRHVYLRVQASKRAKIQILKAVALAEYKNEILDVLEGEPIENINALIRDIRELNHELDDED